MSLKIFWYKSNNTHCRKFRKWKKEFKKLNSSITQQYHCVLSFFLCCDYGDVCETCHLEWHQARGGCACQPSAYSSFYFRFYFFHTEVFKCLRFRLSLTPLFSHLLQAICTSFLWSLSWLPLSFHVTKTCVDFYPFGSSLRLLESSCSQLSKPRMGRLRDLTDAA